MTAKIIVFDKHIHKPENLFLKRVWITLIIGCGLSAALLSQERPVSEVIVRLALQVQVTVDAAPGGNAPAYRSNDAALDALLTHYRPREIRPVFAALPSDAPPTLAQVQRWRLADAAEAPSLLAELAGQPAVVYAEPNRVYRPFADPDDPFYPEQWYLPAIQAPAAWAIETGDPDVVVGVIDTGIDYLHEDLQGQLWINAAEDLNGNEMLDAGDRNGLDDDGNGYIDDVIGWDFTDAPNFPDQGDYLTPDNDPMDEYGSGHGTPIAGIIAARRGNGAGISGIASGLRVMALRAGTASGYLEEDDVAEAILYAVANGCRVVNMSFGDAAFSYLLRDAIQYGASQGVLFVASAGNSGTAALNYPAAFDETVSVGATESGGGLAGFSNYGSTIDLVAPGSAVFAPEIGDAYGPQNGTSFSAPVVCAALGLLLSRNPEYSPEQALGALLAGCRDLGFFGWDPFYGHGLVDLFQSLSISEQGFADIDAPASGSGTAAELVSITGSAFSPHLQSYQLSYGVGENPLTTMLISEVFATQVFRDTLGRWEITGLPDTVYTLELRLRQHGLSDIVQRRHLYIDHTPPQLADLDTTRLLIGPNHGSLIRFRSDDLTLATLFFRPLGESDFSLSKNSRYFQREHNFLISREDISGDVEFYIELANSAGLTTRFDNGGAYYRLRLNAGYPVANILELREAFPFSGYLMPFSSDFNADQTPEFVFSELIDGEQFGPIRIGEFRAGQFRFDPLTAFPAIPRDAGAIRSGEGISLLAGYGDNALLLGGNAPGEYPNAVVWDDTTNFWASRLQNYDADPELELLGINFGRWKIFDILPGSQTVLQQTLPDGTGGSNQLGVPWSLLEDLDGDGRREIIFEDLDGDLYLYEADAAGQYRLVWSVRLPGKGGIGLLQAADLDGDGQKELISAVRNEPAQLLESNINTRFWALTVWRNAGDDQYEPLTRCNVHGVTVQTGIHNGLSAADIDGDGISEIFFTPFPEAYLFRYQDGELALLWYQENINSNGVLVDDFDRNGRPDVLINSDRGILRFEPAGNSNRPLPPVQLHAAALDTARIRLDWVAVPTAAAYRMYRRTPGSDYRQIDSTAVNHWIDTAVHPDTLYAYVITQVDLAYPEPESPYSAPAAAQPNMPPVLSELTVLPGRQLLLRFNEPMSDRAYDTDRYLLSSEGIRPGSAVRGQNRHEVLLSFLKEFTPGAHDLQMTGLSDLQGTVIVGDTLTVGFEYWPAPETLYLQSLELAGKKLLLLRFNQPLDPQSAENAENYHLSPDGTILTAELDGDDPRMVRLHLSGDNRLGSLGVPYYLSVSNLRDARGGVLDAQRANRLAIIRSAADLDEVIVYPNPYRLQSAANPLMFANLPPGCEILIFNAAGKFLRRLEESGGYGGLTWDLRSDRGDLVGSGVYIYVARYDGREKRGKLMILR